jgi:glycerol-3-phosphate acyltransferase PlsY
MIYQIDLLVSLCCVGKYWVQSPLAIPFLSLLLKKNINFKTFLTFFICYITSTLFYYYLNKKTYYNTIFFFFYKFFQLYITSITFHRHSKKISCPNMRGGGCQNGVFQKDCCFVQQRNIKMYIYI